MVGNISMGGALTRVTIRGRQCVERREGGGEGVVGRRVMSPRVLSGEGKGMTK